MITFTRPVLLVLFALLPLAWWQLRHAGRRIVLYKQKRVYVTRLLLLALLVLAAAGAAWQNPSTGRDIIVLIDASDSMPQVFDQTAERLRGQVGPNDRLGFVIFGKEPHVVKTPQQPDLSPARLPNGEGTHIERAIRAGLSLLTPQRPGRLLLISDGLETAGSARDAVTALQQARIPLDVLPVAPTASPEVAVDTFRVPVSVQPKEPFAARAVIIATEQTMATVYVFRNDVLIRENVIMLQAGGNVFTVEGLIEDEGSALYEIVVDAEADTWPHNNRSHAFVHTAGEAAILLLANTPTENTVLSQALTAQHIDVTVQYVGQASMTVPTLQAYDAVILDNISAAQLSAAQMQALSVYVRQAGGGLIISGGDRSYGLGAYAGTALERLSPVQLTGSDTLAIPSIAVVLVIDKSGSMSEIVTETKLSKLDFAKEAVLGVVQSLAGRDLIGIVAFDSHPSWVVPLQNAQQKDWLAAQVLTITADGGTNAYPALYEAYDALFSVPAAVKHVVLLSDGYTVDGDFAGLTIEALNRGVTVSTIGVGDADRELLEQIAAWGGGRHYYTDDPHEIPHIFLSETRRLSPPQVLYRPANVHLVSGHDFLQGLPSPLPPVKAYAVTEEKNDATVHLTTDDGHPLLASRRAGLGRVAAFTGSLTADWAPSWISWPALGPLWSQTVRWTMRRPSTADMQVNLEIHQGRGHLWVDALADDESYMNFLRLTAALHHPDGTLQSIPLHQSGPGRYEATFAAADAGVWTAAIDDEQTMLGDTLFATATVPYSPEYKIQTTNKSLLTYLAQATGGHMLTDMDTPLPTGPAALASGELYALWPLLLTLGIVIFILDIAWRYIPPDLPRFLGRQFTVRLRQPLASWREAQTRAASVRARRVEETKSRAPDSRQQAARDAHTYLARARKKRHGENEHSRRAE